MKEKKKEEGEILQLGSQRGGDLQPEKKKMTEGRKYDKTSSIKSEQPTRLQHAEVKVVPGAKAS